MMKTAIIVLNRNQPEMTDKLCGHLVKFTKADYKLFVIEAGSDKDKLSHYCTHWINDDWTMKNGLRQAKGFNKGIEIADKEGDWDAYWCVINDMNFPKEDTLSLLLEDMKKYPEIGIIQPSLTYSLWGEEKIVSPKYQAPKGKIRLIPYLSHFCILVRKELLDKIYPLYDDSNFRAHYGDVEICWRAYKAGYGVVVSGNCDFWELVGGTYGGSNNPQHKQFMDEAKKEMMDWMGRKYGFVSKDQMRKECGKAMAMFLKNYSYKNQDITVDYLGHKLNKFKNLLRLIKIK